MSMLQLVYASRPFGFDDASLDSILLSARHFNQRDAITGALLCRDDIYLQLLEGPEAAVRATYARIARDGRHIDPIIICDTAVNERLFPSWDMKDDPVESWMWSREAVAAGTVEKASPAEVLGVFAKIAAQDA